MNHKIPDVNLSVFIYKLLHEDLSSTKEMNHYTFVYDPTQAIRTFVIEGYDPSYLVLKFGNNCPSSNQDMNKR